MKIKSGLSLTVVLLLALSAVGCASDESDRGAETSPVQESATKSPLPEPTPKSLRPTDNVQVTDNQTDQVDLPARQKYRRGAATIYNGCDGASDSFPENANIFDPVLGRMTAMPTPTLEQDRQLVSQMCTVAGDASNLSVIYIVTERKPASGLEPETVESWLVSLGLDGAELARTPFPQELDIVSVTGLLPTTFGFVVLSSMYADHVIATFSKETLEPLWMSDGDLRLAGMTNDTFAAHAQENVEFYHLDSGKRISTLTNSEFVTTIENGYIVIGTDGYYLFDSVTKKLSGPLVDEYASFKRSGPYLLMRSSDLLKVYDTESGEFLIERSGPDVVGLGIEYAYISGNYLYILNQDDSPIIDVTTSEKVSDGWARRPLDRIGSEWILVISGPVSNNYDTCFGDDIVENRNRCSNDGQLVRKTDGMFRGPWY